MTLSHWTEIDIWNPRHRSFETLRLWIFGQKVILCPSVLFQWRKWDTSVERMTMHHYKEISDTNSNYSRKTWEFPHQSGTWVASWIFNHVQNPEAERRRARDLRRCGRENDEKLTDYFLIRKGKVNVCKLESNWNLARTKTLDTYACNHEYHFRDTFRRVLKIEKEKNRPFHTLMSSSQKF